MLDGEVISGLSISSITAGSPPIWHGRIFSFAEVAIGGLTRIARSTVKFKVSSHSHEGTSPIDDYEVSHTLDLQISAWSSSRNVGARR